MRERELRQAGPLTRWLAEDHRRLDGLLRAAVAERGAVNDAAYAQFRAGLLRHIGMEEKILLPAVQRIRGGEPLPMAAKLRLDHGALAALLMPTPAPEIVATIRHILAEHNAFEEGEHGLYDTCDALAGPEADRLLGDLRGAPTVTVMPCSDSPAVRTAVRRALERAGYRLAEAEGGAEQSLRCD